jgi:ataxia telangiectasia mutated family protein
MCVPSVVPQLQSWPSEYRQELECLEAYPRPTGTRRPRDINELSTSESCRGTAKAFPEWITPIRTLLCDILAVSKPFYSQLAFILQSDIVFAEKMLPVLVHSVLQAAPEQDKKDVYCIILSNYFASLLMWDAVSTPCLRSIINIVLHLRNFPCPYAKGTLPYNKWLDIDFTLLARNAISCGMYTTSLLFLELAAEYPGSSPADEDVAERILFDIYSHIDEPDGFYGIKTKDLGQILIKRFHHEKQWEKAFRFHGAALEAGNASTAEAKGLLQSFHSFGFNHLAIDTLQKGSSLESGFTFDSSGMSYRLGWRTETWDLPDQTEQRNSGASLYHALRAVHRERNPLAITSIVRRALSEEMERLRVLGPENLVEIREVTQNLMCLTQVTQWMDSSIQSQLQSKQVDIKNWNNFVDVDPNLEYVTYTCHFDRIDFVCRFSDLESILATRVSLIHSVRQKEEREQIGNLLTPFAEALIDIEKKCLVRLSEAARIADQIQIALNSVVRSQKLERTPSFEVSEEFASVLWLHKEQKLAVQFLKQLLPRHDPGVLSDNEIKKALLLARLVSISAPLTNHVLSAVQRVHGHLRLAWKSPPIS